MISAIALSKRTGLGSEHLLQYELKKTGYRDASKLAEFIKMSNLPAQELLKIAELEPVTSVDSLKLLYKTAQA
jgi:hypothetical protein